MDKHQPLVFNKREHINNEILVRFWADKEEYHNFTSACKRNDYIIKDVFRDFMKWFAVKYKEKL